MAVPARSFRAPNPIGEGYAARWAMAETIGRIREERRAGRRPGWLVEVWTEGRQYRVRRAPIGGTWMRLATREMAQAVLDALRADVRAGRTPLQALAPFLGPRAALSFGRAWERFVAAKERQGEGARQLSAKRLGELRGYQRRGYLEPLWGVPAHGVSYGVLEDWLGWMFARRPALAPKTVANVLHDVGTCLRWLERRGDIARAPDLPPVHVPEHAPRIPTPEALERILAAIPWPDRGQYLARGLMGLRPSEARRARVADWDFEARTLTVVGKGDRLRVLPADERVAEWVADQVDPRAALEGALLFARADGRPWSVSASRRTWAAACKAAGAMGRDGMPLFRENEGLRHAFGTHAVNRGVALDRAGAYMGHTSDKTTRRYAKLATAGLVDVVRRRS